MLSVSTKQPTILCAFISNADRFSCDSGHWHGDNKIIVLSPYPTATVKTLLPIKGGSRITSSINREKVKIDNLNRKQKSGNAKIPKCKNVGNSHSPNAMSLHLFWRGISVNVMVYLIPNEIKGNCVSKKWLRNCVCAVYIYRMFFFSQHYRHHFPFIYLFVFLEQKHSIGKSYTDSRLEQKQQEQQTDQ